MMYKKIISITISLALLGSMPLNAQLSSAKKESDAYKPSGGYRFAPFNLEWNVPSFTKSGNISENSSPKAKSAMDFLNGKLNYFEAWSLYKTSNPNATLADFHNEYYIKPAWGKYQEAKKNYLKSEYADYSPYEIMTRMQIETRAISELLKNNPRYKKELKKENARQYGSACLQGIVLALFSVVAVYTAGTALGPESAMVASWFGSSAAIASMTAASASIFKGLGAVVMLEIMISLGLNIVDNLYEDLTQRLLRYNYVTNNKYAQDLAESASKGSVAGILNNTCETPQMPNITPNTPWLDTIAQENAIILLHGLIVIRNELQYSVDPIKYDMAMLDIINLFSGVQQVEFDENVFTRPIIDENGKHYQNNSNIVDIGTGTLIRRTPELLEALKAIQNMDLQTDSIQLKHPRAISGIIWPNK